MFCASFSYLLTVFSRVVVCGFAIYVLASPDGTGCRAPSQRAVLALRASIPDALNASSGRWPRRIHWPAQGFRPLLRNHDSVPLVVVAKVSAPSTMMCSPAKSLSPGLKKTQSRSPPPGYMNSPKTFCRQKLLYPPWTVYLVRVSGAHAAKELSRRYDKTGLA